MSRRYDAELDQVEALLLAGEAEDRLMRALAVAIVELRLIREQLLTGIPTWEARDD